MKKILSVLVVTGFTLTNLAHAAHWCGSYVENISVTPSGVNVSSKNVVNGLTHDPMFLAYADKDFAWLLEKLSQAQSAQTPVKIYVLEEFDGDDAASCLDDENDYIGNVLPY